MQFLKVWGKNKRFLKILNFFFTQGRAPPCPPRHHGHSFSGQAGQACYIWIATTECWVREQPATTAAGWRPGPGAVHLSCTRPGHHRGGGQQKLYSSVSVSVICVGNVSIICRAVLVMSDVRARLTSRVVPPYTSYTGHTVAAAAAW